MGRKACPTNYARVPNITGLAFNLVGILILLRWGMPFRVESHGNIGLLADNADPRGLALDRIYTICGWAGLILLIVGVILQIVAQLLPPTSRVRRASEWSIMPPVGDCSVIIEHRRLSRKASDG
jgi:hypothetical protein